MSYPQPVLRFSVDWRGTKVPFSEVSGLNIETQVIEYRDGSEPECDMRKMPGLLKYGNIRLKRGIFKSETSVL